MRNTVIHGTTLGLMVFVLAGCAAQQRERFQYVEGLNPVQDAASVETSTKAQTEVFNALKSRAGLTAAPTTGKQWAQFVEGGFDYVDERCDQYLDALFWYDRYRSTLQSQIGLTGAAAASIMGIVDVAAKPIAVVAAAFGYAAETANNISSSLLFQLAPSGLKSLVDRQRAQYRHAAKAKQALHRPQAMALVRGYLSICLPASIETQVNGAVAEIGFVEDASAGDSTVPVLTRTASQERSSGIDRSVNIARINAGEAQTAASAPANTPRGAGVVSGALNDIEKALSKLEGKAIQESLCVAADGVFGDSTRDAIKSYYHARGRKDQRSLRTNGDSISLVGMNACKDTQYKSSFERFKYRDKAAIVALQERINIAFEAASQAKIPTSGAFDAMTRDAIKKLQPSISEEATGVVTPKFDETIGIE